MSSKSLLIISNQNEQEVDGVIDFLRDRNVEVIRWNLCQFPENEYFTISSSSFLFPKIQNTDIPRVAWLHHYGQFSIENSLTGLEREVSLKECKGFVEGLLLSLNCVWFNNPLNIIHVSNKVFQLRIAQKLKIPFPEYIITNDKNQVQKFVASKKSVIIKSISAGYISYDKINYKIYSRQFFNIPEQLLSALKFAPVILQEEIEKKREIRVTVIKGQCFSIEIDFSNLPKTIDVRELIQDKNRHLFRRAKKVKDIEEMSIKLTNTFDLSYAGIDWIESTDGNFYFLEVNPLGSFKWYEQCGKYDITKAIGRCLLAKFNNEKY